MVRQAAGAAVWKQVGGVLVALLLLTHVAAATAQLKADPKRNVAADTTQQLTALAEAQRAMATPIAQLREDVATLQRGLQEIQNDEKQLRESDQAGYQHNKEMREEVRGLYVETSGLKGDIAQASSEIQALQEDVGNFRFSFGLIAALILVLQLVLAGLIVRSRA